MVETRNSLIVGIYKIMVLASMVTFFSSCSSTHYFIHEPTNHLRDSIEPSDFQGNEKYIDGGILFVPDFTYFSNAYSEPGSGLKIYSKNIQSLYLHNFVIRADGIPKLTIEINKNFEIKLPGTSNYFYEIVGIANESNLSTIALENYFKSGFLVIDASYSLAGSDEIRSMTFELDRKTGISIHWAT